MTLVDKYLAVECRESIPEIMQVIHYCCCTISGYNLLTNKKEMFYCHSYHLHAVFYHVTKIFACSYHFTELFEIKQKIFKQSSYSVRVANSYCHCSFKF